VVKGKDADLPGFETYFAMDSMELMQLLGYKYSKTKKCYYVYGHKNKENVKARKHFIAEYWKNKFRAHCWIQLTEEQAQELGNDPNNPLWKETYHSYVKDDMSMQ
jgi:hypothetical protein